MHNNGEEERIKVPRGQQPLPIKDGLNPSRVRVADCCSTMTAGQYLHACIRAQRYRHPADDEQAIAQRFASREVIIGPRFRIATMDTVVQPGDDIWFYRIPAPEPEIPFGCEILFEDENILVAIKPSFMATMPRSRHIVQTATVQLRRATGIAELAPAHRLDRLTAGLLLFTKKPAIRGAYQDMFAKKQVQKTYQAIAAHSSVTPGTHWKSRILKEHGQVCSYVVPGTPNAHTEVLGVQPLNNALQEYLSAIHKVDAPQSVYTLRPHTGKTHQLRVHMHQAGIPITGDPFYPELLPVDAEDYGIPLRLTATALAFEDPISHQQREFKLPEDLLWPDLHA